jgi:hypothetical protein
MNVSVAVPALLARWQASGNHQLIRRGERTGMSRTCRRRFTCPGCRRASCGGRADRADGTDHQVGKEGPAHPRLSEQPLRVMATMLDDNVPPGRGGRVAQARLRRAQAWQG